MCLLSDDKGHMTSPCHDESFEKSTGADAFFI